ncbi:hypothetical protein BGZ58_007486 [Dissophora ornata]|nr:hypothetical protein BGZ58_007486 [Dissophora ornata]
MAQSTSSFKELIALQTTKLVHLLQSIDYPYEISQEDIHTALSNHFTSATLHHAPDPKTAPTMQFLSWLVENVSAETNWPGYQHHHPSHPIVQPTDDLPSDIAPLGEEENDATVRSLDQEHRQLQATLASLEKELADLNALETHGTATNRVLDMDIHDASIQLDATATKLEETAKTVFSQYLASSNQGRDRDVDMDRDHTSASTVASSRRRVVDATSSSSSSSVASKRFLYQFQEELFQIQQLDAKYIKVAESLFQQILETIALPSPAATTTNTITNANIFLKSPKSSLSLSSSSTSLLSAPSSSSPSSSYFDRLLKRNPAQDQELVRLCSTYRATKMSHIRAMAQLKCLEEELQYMKDLDAKHEGGARAIMSENNGINNNNTSSNGTNDGGEQDMTNDYSMYTIASSRNEQIRNTRQQEIELISVQRETTRLMDEMEQLLSDPAPRPVTTSGQNSLSALTDQNENYNDTGAAGGVLFDICERIARNDVELEFLTAAHQDHLHGQEQALKELDDTIARLLEYYSLGMTVEQILHVEKEMVQTQKDILGAAVVELQELRQQSERLNILAKNRGYRERHLQQSGGDDGPSNHGAGELLDLIKQNAELTNQARQERQKLQENIQQMTNVKDLLGTELLYQHSTTDQIQFVPKTTQSAKDDIVKRTRQLQHDYVILSDQTQHFIRKKPIGSSI